MFQIVSQIKKKFLFSLISFSIMICIKVPALFADNQKAWELLLDNKPNEATNEFEKTINDADVNISAEGFRGLATTELFLGNLENILEYGISAYEKDRDILKSASRPDILLFSRSNSKNEKRIYKTLVDISKKGGMFSGWYQDEMLKRYLDTGNLKKAKELIKKMGIQQKWKFIGPFENISNCGFSNIYPPEKEIIFDKEYDGKSGNITKWNDLYTTDINGWIFLDNITAEYNSIYYFTNTVYSKQMREIYLSFGASGTFKIFLNGDLVLQDSVFRNTGIDSYVQKVTLRKGANRILIKIGHEGIGSSIGLSGISNFLLRFLDLSYSPAVDLQTDTSDTLVVPGKKIITYTSNSPVIDTLTKYLRKRIQKDTADYDALFALVTIYNMYEMTNESQKIIQYYLKKWPSSSILHSSLAESQLRAKKYTEASVSIKKAYELCNLNMIAWSKQLENIKTSGNLRSLEDFFKKSPDNFKNTAKGILTSLTIAITQKNSSEILRIISELETRYKDNTDIAITLISIYSSQGMLDKAEKLIEEQIKNNPRNTMLHFEIAKLLLKKGNREGAIKWYQQAIASNPEEPDAYIFLSNHYYQEKNYSLALEFAEKCELLTPSNANVLNLKGNILSSMGRTDDAITAFKKTIKYTSDDFIAWESILRLSKQAGFEELTPLQPLDSIISESSEWVKKNNDRPSLINYTEDIYMYPSRATRSRTFIVMHLPNQQSIDMWKEYRIPHNPNYQLLSVDRALSKKNDGSEIEADYNNSFVVFKSLEPGDYIILEYSIKDYYQGVMAGKVYGTQLFGNGIPEFATTIRMVTSEIDTIPYFLSDTSLNVSSNKIKEYRITTIKSKRSSSKITESFAPQYHPDYTAFVYSNIKSWKEIADWYYELSRHKQKQTLELVKITDSLITGVKTEWEKALRIHQFISRTINYSYVPFRQSAWIPQSAGDVFATRIGDCKDMASLGKAMMDIAGIESWLVLVNTGIRHFTGFAHIGPNFDHCILSFNADGNNYFVDFTSRNTALGKLPAADQGAMALVIKPGNDSLITLPFDSSSDRTIKRLITMKIDSSGEMKQSVSTYRTGIYASSLRDMYRFVPYDEQKKTLHRSIADEYPDVVLDTINFLKIDSLYDTLNYEYSFTASHAADISNSTVILPLKIPDALNADYYPLDENRTYPVDMSYSAAGITDQDITVECSFPKEWKLINKPENVISKSDAIEYSLSFNVDRNKLICKRKYKSNFNGVLSAEEYKKELEVLKKVTRADDIKLVFSK